MRKSAEQRITEMESIFDSANGKLNALENAIADLQGYQEEIRRLEAYYTGPDWKKDYALDEAGKLPADLKRGVLSEDGIFDLLERNRELLSCFAREDGQ